MEETPSLTFFKLDGQMKRYFPLLLMLFAVFFAACGGEESVPATATTVPPITSTPDLCSEASLPNEVGKVNKLTREFDDYSALASNTPQQQLVVIIPELQRILRDAEDQAVPPCLMTLKEFQLAHMQTVVQTLLAFVSSADVNLINAGIAQSRELHAQYDIEMARLLGLTLVVPTTAPAETQSTAPAEGNVQPTPTLTATVTNQGTNELNLRSAPDFYSPALTVLPVGGSTVALGRTADNQWIQVQVPDQPGSNAWVYASVVQLSVPIETLPVVTP